MFQTFEVNSQGYKFTFQENTEASDSNLEYMDLKDLTYVPEEDPFTSTSLERASSPRSMDDKPPETKDESSDYSTPPSLTLKNVLTPSMSSTNTSK